MVTSAVPRLERKVKWRYLTISLVERPRNHHEIELQGWISPLAKKFDNKGQ